MLGLGYFYKEGKKTLTARPVDWELDGLFRKRHHTMMRSRMDYFS